MANEATATNNTGLSPEVEAAMHATFGISTPPAKGTPPDPDAGEVEIKVEGEEEIPPTTRDKESEKVVPLARIKDRLDKQRGEVEGILTQAQQRHAEADAREARIAKAEKTLKEREEILEILDSGDPAEYFARTKKDPREFLERLARSGEQGAKDTSRLTKLERETQDLREKLAQKEQAERENGKRETQAEMDRRHAALRQQADQNFIAQISPDTHPHLTEKYDEREVVDLARRVLSEVVGTDAKGNPVSRAAAFEMRYGKLPDDAMVASFLETREAERKATRATAGWTKKEKTTPADKPTISPRPKERASARPIPNDTRPQPSNLSQEEIDRQSVAILEAAIRNSKKEE